MGLLDDFSGFAKTPEGQGLLSAVFGGLANARPNAPLNSLGNAGLAGLSGYSGALDRNMQLDQAAQLNKSRDQQMQYQKMQMDEMQRKADREKEMQGLAAQFAIPAKPASNGGVDQSLLPEGMRTGANVAPMPAQPASFDFGGYANAIAKVDPVSALSLQQSLVKDNTPITVKEGESLVDKKTLKPVFQAPKILALPPAVQEYNFAKSQGESRPFSQWLTDQKRAGATNVSTKIENKMGDSLAGQVGPMVKDTYTAAQGAVQQADAASRIIKAVDSGQIIAGPMASGRMKIAQIGQLLGATGKDDADTIARSRDVIRGLSEMTLQGRKQMTGQGAITESEGKLAEKANSGDITDLTPAEIKQLARASARAANFVYQQHADNLTNLQGDPNTAGLAKFYKVRPMPSVDMGNTSIDDLVNKYRSK